MQHTISLSGQNSEDLAHILLTLLMKFATIEESIKLDASQWEAEDVHKIASVALHDLQGALTILELPKDELDRIHQAVKSDLGM